MSPNQLKKLRKEKRISQTAIALRADVSRYRISQFECGYVELTKNEKLKIKEVLNATR